MSESGRVEERKVLIASANPLFARGLERIVTQRWTNKGVKVRIASSTQEALRALDAWRPNLLIVDYDVMGKAGSIQRETFLSHFITEDRPMKVMFVSLDDSGEVIVYDRRTLTPAQVEDWLDLPSDQPETLRQVAPIPAAHSFLRRGGMKHYVVAGILTVILTVLTFLALQAIGILPTAASVQAEPIDRMVEIQLWMISFLFSLILVFVVYSVIVFRRRKNEPGDGVYFKGSTRLEVVWTLLPLATVIYLSFLGAQALGEVRKPALQAMQINVIAFQWGWIFEYPDYGIQSNTLYMPLNRQAVLKLTSRDVIHSFWVKEFRVKQDALPGANLVKDVRITPNKIGDYTVMCAELCGGAHAYMNSAVKVVNQEDFDAWVKSELAVLNIDPADRGERLANGSGCLACHSVDGKKLAGPTWKNLAGSEITLQDGSSIKADDAYLFESIVDPNAKLHQGFAPVMPVSYQDTLSQQQIQDIVNFIKTLQ